MGPGHPLRCGVRSVDREQLSDFGRRLHRCRLSDEPMLWPKRSASSASGRYLARSIISRPPSILSQTSSAGVPLSSISIVSDFGATRQTFCCGIDAAEGPLTHSSYGADPVRPKRANLVRQTSTSIGSSELALTGTVAPYRRFADAFVEGDVVEVMVTHAGSGQWQAGSYRYDAMQGGLAGAARRDRRPIGVRWAPGIVCRRHQGHRSRSAGPGDQAEAVDVCFDVTLCCARGRWRRRRLAGHPGRTKDALLAFGGSASCWFPAPPLSHQERRACTACASPRRTMSPIRIAATDNDYRAHFMDDMVGQPGGLSTGSTSRDLRERLADRRRMRHSRRLRCRRQIFAPILLLRANLGTGNEEVPVAGIAAEIGRGASDLIARGAIANLTLENVTSSNSPFGRGGPGSASTGSSAQRHCWRDVGRRDLLPEPPAREHRRLLRLPGRR